MKMPKIGQGIVFSIWIVYTECIRRKVNRELANNMTDFFINDSKDSELKTQACGPFGKHGMSLMTTFNIYANMHLYRGVGRLFSTLIFGTILSVLHLSRNNIYRKRTKGIMQ